MDISALTFISPASKDFDDVLESIDKSNTVCEDVHFRFSRLYITTITVLSDISSAIDLSAAYRALQSKYDLVYQPDRTAPPPEGKRMFYNCMKWEKQVRDGDVAMKVSSKIFPNGKFQFTGFKTIKAINVVPRFMLKELRGTQDLGAATMNDIKIVQMNSTFYILKDKTKWNILQRKLHDILMTKEHISVGGRVVNSTFKPEKYPGINVKFKCQRSEKNITILIFSTGSALINGGYDIEDYKAAYDMVCRLVMEHRDTLITRSLV